MDSLSFLPDEIDRRPTKRQRTASPADSSIHHSTIITHETDARPATETLTDTSMEAKEDAIPADGILSIPGLGLIHPECPKPEAPQFNAQVSNDSGLLDALMQHVDSQSNVQGQQPVQQTKISIQETQPLIEEAQQPLQDTSKSAAPNGDKPAASTASSGTAKDATDRRRLGTNSQLMGAGNVGETEHELDSTPAVAMGLSDLVHGEATRQSNLHAAESLTEGFGGATSTPRTGVDLVQEEEMGVTESTADRQEQSDDLLSVTSQPQRSTQSPAPTPLIEDSRGTITVPEGESVNRREDLERNETIKDGRPVKQAVADDVTMSGGPTGTDFMDEGVEQGENADVNDTNEDRVQAHRTGELERAIPASSPTKDDKGESCISQSTVDVEMIQSQDKEAVQHVDAQMAQSSTDQQMGNSLLSTMVAADSNVSSLCEQLPSIGNIEESENTQSAEHAEWEIDSSPMDSSSDSDTGSDTTSTDDSDEDDVDVDGDYAMLNPEEQARILMQGDGGSDDEGNTRNGAKGGGAHLRTTNEKPEEVVPKPDILVTADMKIEELGNVEAIVENTVLVKAKVSGEYRVLEHNSLLCLQDRSVVGIVSETLGRVQQPLYTIRFTNEESIKEAGLASKNTPVYYVEQHSTFVFTQPLRAVKGSDASNFHDEEVGAEEMEFSDDEAEAEHKRRLKLKRQGRNEDRSDRFGRSRGRGASTNAPARTAMRVNGDTTAEMNYDDIPPMSDDGYTPLARPTNLHEMMGQGEAPLESREPVPSFAERGHNRGRGRGRGRGDRGSRGGRGGRGRGGWDRSSNNQPRDRSGSLSNGQQSSSVPNSEPSSSPRLSSTQGHRQQQQPQTPTFALPPIPPPSQHPYPPMPPPLQTPSFSYQTPIPPQAPTISPQPLSYPLFSPSPISPLPQSHFNFYNYATQHDPQQSPIQSYNRYQPPPPHQQHLYQDNNQQQQQQWQHPFSTGQNQGVQQQQPQMPPPGSHINPAFFEALRQQREGGGGNWQGGRR